MTAPPGPARPSAPGAGQSLRTRVVRTPQDGSRQDRAPEPQAGRSWPSRIISVLGRHWLATLLLAVGLVLRVITQMAYHPAKGSVPVRMDIDPSQLDACARDSWQTLARPGSALLPSIAHRMAAVESVREAMGGVLHRFIKTRGMTPQEAQAQLVAIVRGAAR